MTQAYSRRSLMKMGLAGLAGLTALPALAMTPSRKKGFCGAQDLYRAELNCGWYYNWGLEPYGGVDLPFAPMVWGWRDDRSPQRLQALRGRPSILFGFNEPDGRNQANMSVPQALDAWPQIQDLADEIVSPSCVNARGRWMQNFMLQADKRGLRIDAIGVHSYSGPNADQVIARLEETWRLYGRPLWVTEIAVADWRAAKGQKRNRYSSDDTLRFMRQIVGFMDRTPWIKGYCWLASGTAGDGGPLSTSAFFDAKGRASAAFRQYAAL